MAKASRLAGATSNIFEIFIQDSTSTAGAGKTGLLFSGITGYYKRSNGTAAVQITMATITTLGTFATGGLKEVDATNMPGLYEVHIPDTAFATGAKNVVVMYKGGTNMAPVLLEIELTVVDNQDGVHFGITGIPNAAAGAVGGLPLAVDTSGRVDVLKINGTSQTARDIGLSVLLSSGTGTGQLSLTAGKVDLAGDIRLRKNTALANFTFRMTDSSDHVSPKTGLTVAGAVTIDGAAFASLTNAVAEIANGWYKVSLAAADVNGDTIGFKFTATGADQLDVTIVTQVE